MGSLDGGRSESMERLVQRVSALSRGGPKMRRVEKREALSIELERDLVRLKRSLHL